MSQNRVELFNSKSPVGGMAAGPAPPSAGRSNPSQLLALEALKKSREESRNLESSLMRNVRIKHMGGGGAANESKLDFSNHDNSLDQ